jgi:hypothetical protein
MKIKILSPLGMIHTQGQIVDAIICPADTNFAMAFDASGVYYSYFKPQFEIYNGTPQIESIKGSIREMLGQDISRIEFK